MKDPLEDANKQFWKDRAVSLDKLLRGTRLILAGLVHQVGGEVILTEETLALMDSGEFVMNQKTRSDPVSVQIIVAPKAVAPADVDPQENTPES